MDGFGAWKPVRWGLQYGACRQSVHGRQKFAEHAPSTTVRDYREIQKLFALLSVLDYIARGFRAGFFGAVYFVGVF